MTCTTKKAHEAFLRFMSLYQVCNRILKFAGRKFLLTFYGCYAGKSFAFDGFKQRTSAG